MLTPRGSPYAPPASDIKICCCSCRKGMQGVAQMRIRHARPAIVILVGAVVYCAGGQIRNPDFAVRESESTAEELIASRRAHYCTACTSSITSQSHHNCAVAALEASSRRCRRPKVCWNSVQMDKLGPKPDVLSTLRADITCRSHSPRSRANKPLP